MSLSHTNCITLTEWLTVLLRWYPPANAMVVGDDDLPLQYLAAVAYLQHQLWGKAQHTLEQLVRQPQLKSQHTEIARRAHLHLAQLAQTQGRAADAHIAWREAALLAQPKPI